MDHGLLGKILASVVLAASEAGVLAKDPKGAVTDAQGVADIISGFMEVWGPHPASGSDISRVIPPEATRTPERE